VSSRLDRIEAWAKFALKNGGPEDKFEDVLALVNVAKAAEEMREWLWQEAEHDAPPHGWKAREDLIAKADEALAALGESK
jgi:hypothetical protein